MTRHRRVVLVTLALCLAALPGRGWAMGDPYEATCRREVRQLIRQYKAEISGVQSSLRTLQWHIGDRCDGAEILGAQRKLELLEHDIEAKITHLDAGKKDPSISWGPMTAGEIAQIKDAAGTAREVRNAVWKYQEELRQHYYRCHGKTDPYALPPPPPYPHGSGWVSSMPTPSSSGATRDGALPTTGGAHPSVATPAAAPPPTSPQPATDQTPAAPTTHRQETGSSRDYHELRRPETGSSRPDSDRTGRGPLPAPTCCERCEPGGTYRFYVTMPPDTACQPGDVPRGDLSSAQCANPQTLGVVPSPSDACSGAQQSQRPAFKTDTPSREPGRSMDIGSSGAPSSADDVWPPSAPPSTPGLADAQPAPQPPPARPDATPPPPPDPNRCTALEGDAAAHVKTTMDRVVKIWRNEETRLFTFQFEEGKRFNSCSEYFRFLVENGWVPFNEESFIQGCIGRFRTQLRDGGYDRCVNYDDIMNATNRACRHVMGEKIRNINEQYGRQMLEYYRRCPEPTPPPHVTGPTSDFLHQPTGTPGGTPPTTGASAPTDGTPPTGVPPPTPSPAPPTDAIHPASDTGGLHTVQPLPGGAAFVQRCCERCPGTDDFRIYVTMPPNTDCEPGDARRDDLIAPQCAGNLFIDPNAPPAPPTFGPACCDRSPDQMLFNTVRSGDVTSDVGAVLKDACGPDPCAKGRPSSGKTPPRRLEVSVLSTGNDVHGRNWVPERPLLNAGGRRLKPCQTSKFYVVREAAMHDAAVAVFTAIGSRYERDARRAEAAPGTSCHAGGAQPVDERGPTALAVDRAGMAAGLGLLASQAKGQITGLRATFDVTGLDATALRDAMLQAEVVNEITQQQVHLRTPMRFNARGSSDR